MSMLSLRQRCMFLPHWSPALLPAATAVAKTPTFSTSLCEAAGAEGAAIPPPPAADDDEALGRWDTSTVCTPISFSQGLKGAKGVFCFCFCWRDELMYIWHTHTHRQTIATATANVDSLFFIHTVTLLTFPQFKNYRQCSTCCSCCLMNQFKRRAKIQISTNRTKWRRQQFACADATRTKDNNFWIKGKKKKKKNLLLQLNIKVNWVYGRADWLVQEWRNQSISDCVVATWKNIFLLSFLLFA